MIPLQRGLYVFVGTGLFCLFVCWQDYAKNIQPDITKFLGILAYRPREKLLRFWWQSGSYCVNGLGLWLGRGPIILHVGGYTC